MTLREPLGHRGPLLILSLHKHDLKWQKTTKTFKCNGCNQDGKGGKYECDKCQFYLHEKCTLPPSTIVCVGREFRFHHQVPGDMNCDGNKCDACNKVVRGFCYSRNRDYVVHPCCANLPPVLHSKSLKLYLSKKLSKPCIKCEKEGPGWSYTSKSRKHNLHVACAEAWAEKVREKQAQIPEKVPPKNQHDAKGKGRGGGGGQILKYDHLIDGVMRLIAALAGDFTPFIEAVVN